MPPDDPSLNPVAVFTGLGAKRAGLLTQLQTMNLWSNPLMASTPLKANPNKYHIAFALLIECGVVHTSLGNLRTIRIDLRGMVGFLSDWDLSYEEIDELLTKNPSLRSFVMGYTAELKCRRIHFDGRPFVSNITKYDDHDRLKKGDIAFDYKDYTFTVEVKSLQSNSLKPRRNGEVKANFQCDGSDSRIVHFADGTNLKTTSLLVGEFDILAVNLHAFYGDWKFVFADNRDLPTVRTTRGAASRYTEYQMDLLLRSTMPMDNPPSAPYEDLPWGILDRLVAERRAAGMPTNSELAAQNREFGVEALEAEELPTIDNLPITSA